jgi:hypothetical protein
MGTPAGPASPFFVGSATVAVVGSTKNGRACPDAMAGIVY